MISQLKTNLLARLTRRVKKKTCEPVDLMKELGADELKMLDQLLDELKAHGKVATLGDCTGIFGEAVTDAKIYLAKS